MAEESTLEGVIERLRAEGQLTRNSGTNSIKTLIETNNAALGTLSQNMGELIDFFKGNALQDEENRRELLKTLKGGKKEKKEVKIEKKETSLFDGVFQGGLAAILGGLTAAAVGLTAGFVFGVGQFFVLLLKPLTNFIKQSKVFRGLQKTTTGFGKTIKSIGNTIKTLTNSFKSFISQTKLFRTLRVEIKLFGRNVRPVVDLFKELGKRLSGITKSLPTQALGRVFSPIKDFFKAFGKILPNFFKVGKSLGKTFLPLLGKLFIPLTVLISLFDFVKGAMSGFEKYSEEGFIEGLIGGLLGGISGLATGLIGMPLDLLKSAISWVAEKLGFDNFSEMLDSFSFSELIGGLFTKVTDVLVGFIGSIKEKIANIGWGGMIKNMALDLLKIVKKIYTFPLAVATGAGAALAAALPGGQTPMEAFKEKFAMVFNGGDAAIDSLKTVSSGGSGEEVSDESLAVKDGEEPKKGFFAGLFSSDKAKSSGGSGEESSFDRMGRESSDKFDRALEGKNNTTGAEMEVGMSNIADAKSQPAPVIVSGGSSGPQNTTVNNNSTTYNGSDHPEPSGMLTMSYGYQ